MPTKLKKPKAVIKKKSMNDALNEIDTKLTNLQELSTSSSLNMSDILNLHNSIGKNIEIALQKLNEIKTDFTNGSKQNSLDVIDADDFQQLLNEINSLCGEIDADTPIEELIKLYEESSHKINLCENYLKSKQMNIIYCDDVEDDN